MLMVCACGGSTCSIIPTFCPSCRPISLAKVASTSTAGRSCWLTAGLPLRPSRPTTGAILRLLCMPVHPTKTDLGAAFLLSEAPGGGGWRYVSSTTTFWATVFAFTSTETSEDGRLTRQFLSDCCRATSAWTTLPAGFLGGMMARVEE